MRKTRAKVVAGLLFLVAVFMAYTIWDNNRITVVEQEILIKDLPEELEGYSILQVTDLHEKEFGNNQKRLIEAINSIDYDAIAFTGDMLDGSKSKNYQPFYTLIEGIENKDTALFVPGNADPKSYLLHPDQPLEKNAFIKGMEKRGVKFLETLQTTNLGDSSVHFVDFEWSIKDAKKELEVMNGSSKSKNSKPYFDHQRQLLDEISTLDDIKEPDLLIALNHYPVVDARIDQLINEIPFTNRNFDLLMAGHYHGGQIRLPLLGALFVPEPWYKRNGLFPPRNRVKGLWKFKQTKQYVSAGLGSSDAIPFLKFRFFNPPEVDVLTFKRQ
ncbi:hypothetical protein ELQ35_06975 [Peribacillus cavernae]|uniref:Calcineurin-like phosphoesterase domain-containing protein n=1 Tax=Peribacillus cavernae TaxID=1674310 RepID=A0A3S0VPW1_9BACI|nr:metallophosphoesterase [Peribacillus cavernae]MDQ0217469.1 putative MPP superfamily phosphohydrolase [Peribacillus cavernae]RUQ30088.1 hypothetical protein ELQ35_06975 [Peribacillus cavernae]